MIISTKKSAEGKMTNYTASYDTLGNYQETSPITEAIASPSQLENSVNSQVPPLPRQSRKKMPTWKKVLIGGIVAGSLTASYGGYRFLKFAGELANGFNWGQMGNEINEGNANHYRAIQSVEQVRKLNSKRNNH